MSTGPLGGRLPTGTGSTAGGAATEIQAGAPVVGGPDGVPPTGMKAFRVVDDDPTVAPGLVSPAGTVIVLRDGSAAWLALGGTEYVSSVQLERARELANNATPILDLATNVGVLHSYIDNRDGYETVRGFFAGTAQSNCGSLIPYKAALTAGDWFRLCDGVTPTTYVDYQFQLDVTPVEAGRVAIDVSDPAVVSGADVWLVVRAAIEAAAPNVVFGAGGNAGPGPGPTTDWFQAFSLSVLTLSGSASNSTVNEKHVATEHFQLAQFSGGREAFDILANISTTAAVQAILNLPQVRTVYDADFSLSTNGLVNIPGLDSTRDYEILIWLTTGAAFPMDVDVFPDNLPGMCVQNIEGFRTPAILLGSAAMEITRNEDNGLVLARGRTGSGSHTYARGRLTGNASGRPKLWEAVISYHDLPGVGSDDFAWAHRSVGQTFRDFTSLGLSISDQAAGHITVRELRR
jgi:hypothetical protein